MVRTIFPVANVSLPLMLSFGESSGTVQVCAVLATIPGDATTSIAIMVTIATNDTMISGTGLKTGFVQSELFYKN